jgi:hypothetical protein
MNLWQEAMRLMLSNANPWVALASAHAKVSNGPDMVRRGGEYHGATSVRSGSAAATPPVPRPDAGVESAAPAGAALPAASQADRSTGWLARFLDRMEARTWERERRALDAYLADSVDLYDLEARMRQYDRGLARREQAFSYH